MIGQCPFMHGMTHNVNSAIPVNPQTNNNRANKKSSVDGNTADSGIFAAKQQTDKKDSAKDEPHYSTYLGNDILLNLQTGPSRLKPQGKGLMHHE